MPATPPTQALDIIVNALDVIAVLAVGETPSNSEAQRGLTTLNLLIDDWNSQLLQEYSVDYETYAWPANQAGPVTIGPGGTINITRPVAIRAAVAVLNGITHPLALPGAEEWSLVEEKTTNTAQVPKRLYNDYGYPLSNLYMHPVPLAGVTLQMWNYFQLSQYAALTSSVDLPPSYWKAIVYNLAVLLAPIFGAVLTQDVANIAAQSLSSIRSLNAPPAPGKAQMIAAQAAVQAPLAQLQAAANPPSQGS